MRQWLVLLASIVLVLFLLSGPASKFSFAADPNLDVLTFTPVDDAYLRGDKPEQNFGTRDSLQVDGSPQKDFLLKFSVSGVGDRSVVSGRLRLYNIDPSSAGGDFYPVADTSWSEETVTWDSAPAADAIMLAALGEVSAGSWYEVDVTSLVTGDGTVSLRVTTSSSNGADYHSKEGPEGLAPQLVVTVSSSTLAPTPSPGPGGDPVLVGAGDIADCDSNGDESTAKLLDRVFAASSNGVVFTAGDNVYSAGTPSEFADCYDPSWGQHKARTRPSVGNHDYGHPGAAGYFDYFGAAAGDPGKGYYSYDLGDWHIVVLNSNCSEVGGCGAGSAQESWLRADLAANPSACTLAYWHHPRFSSGKHGNDTSVQDIWQALYEYRADVVVNGHEHDYERFAPQDPNGAADPAQGIRQFVVGTGGKNLYSFGVIQPNSEVRNSDTFGVLKLTLHATGYDWEFIPVAGSTFSDSGSQTCNSSQKGDVDCDGDVDAVDSLKVLRYIVGLSVSQAESCPGIGSEVASLFGDMDCDDDIDEADSLKILRYAAGLPGSQMEPCSGVGTVTP